MSASISPYADTPTAREVLQRFLDWVEPGELFASSHVLEMGCGAGHLTEEICKRVGESGFVLATDPDASYLEEARVRLTEQGVGQVGFKLLRVQDIAQLEEVSPGGYRSFEFWLWANGIHYLEEKADIERFFQGTRGVCLSGYFCTSFWQGSVDRRAFSVLGSVSAYLPIK